MFYLFDVVDISILSLTSDSLIYDKLSISLF